MFVSISSPGGLRRAGELSVQLTNIKQYDAAFRCLNVYSLAA